MRPLPTVASDAAARACRRNPSGSMTCDVRWRLARSDDRLAERMLGTHFGGCRGGKQLVAGRRRPPGRWTCALRAPEGQRSGLVEHDRVDMAQVSPDTTPPLMIAPSRAARPMAPRIASGVPAAMPQAPATMMTEIVEWTSRVTGRSEAARAEREIDEIAGQCGPRALRPGRAIVSACSTASMILP